MSSYYVVCRHVMAGDLHCKVSLIEPSGPDLLGTLACEQCLEARFDTPVNLCDDTLFLVCETRVSAQIAQAKAATGQTHALV
jgi:hypothetical protein